MTASPPRREFRRVLYDRTARSLLGVLLSVCNPDIVELCGEVGLDFIVIDAEHEPFTDREIAELVRAADVVGMMPIVRLASDEPARMLRALDSGAGGIQIPHCLSTADLDRVVEALYFPPAGGRTLYNLGRSGPFAAPDHDDRKWTAQTDEEVLLVITIEDHRAVAELEAILSSPNAEHVDAVYVGRKDLWVSLGMPGGDELEREVDVIAAAVASAEIALAGTLRLERDLEGAVRSLRRREPRMIAVPFFDFVRRQGEELVRLFEDGTK